MQRVWDVGDLDGEPILDECPDNSDEAEPIYRAVLFFSGTGRGELITEHARRHPADTHPNRVTTKPSVDHTIDWALGNR